MILNKNGEILNTDFFNQLDFKQARKKARSQPELADFFAWLDTPQEYVENFMKQQN